MICRNSVIAGLRIPAVIAVLLVVSSGCSYPHPVRTYEYVTRYERMTDQYEPLISLVYVPHATSLARYRGIIVGEMSVGNQWVDSPAEALGYATFLRVLLRRELVKLGKFELVSLDKDFQERDESLEGLLVMDGMITKFDMGSGLMRYMSFFLWFLESGATDLQIEGRLTEADSGKLVLEFIDRRRHLGNTPYGPNPDNFGHDFAMRVTARETARCMAKFVEQVYEELPSVVLEEPATQGDEAEL